MPKSAFEIAHPELNISATTTRDHLIASFGNLSPNDMGTGWVWYALPPFTDGDAVIGMALGFNRGKLEMLRFLDVHHRFGTGWSDWSEENERLRAEHTGNWLKRNGYPNGSYPWGVVSVGFDLKGDLVRLVYRFDRKSAIGQQRTLLVLAMDTSSAQENVHRRVEGFPVDWVEQN